MLSVNREYNLDTFFSLVTSKCIMIMPRKEETGEDQWWVQCTISNYLGRRSGFLHLKGPGRCLGGSSNQTSNNSLVSGSASVLVTVSSPSGIARPV